jgi:hypothetical protein
MHRKASRQVCTLAEDQAHIPLSYPHAKHCSRLTCIADVHCQGPARHACHAVVEPPASSPQCADAVSVQQCQDCETKGRC